MFNKKKEKKGGVSKKILVSLIRFYQIAFSTFFGPCCRFTPSCSSYASLSVQRFGIVEGLWLTTKRLLKCQPFHPGGEDPVPESEKHPLKTFEA
jgi:uncharacterized protein